MFWQQGGCSVRGELGLPLCQTQAAPNCSKGLHLMEKAHIGAVLEELQLMGKSHIGEVCERWYPRERLHAGAGEQHEEKGVAETKIYELTTTPIPHPLHHLGEKRYKSGE